MALPLSYGGLSLQSYRWVFASMNAGREARETYLPEPTFTANDALNAEGLTTATGAPWTGNNVAKAQQRLRATLAA